MRSLRPGPRSYAGRGFSFERLHRAAILVAVVTCALQRTGHSADRFQTLMVLTGASSPYCELRLAPAQRLGLFYAESTPAIGTASIWSLDLAPACEIWSGLSFGTGLRLSLN